MSERPYTAQVRSKHAQTLRRRRGRPFASSCKCKRVCSGISCMPLSSTIGATALRTPTMQEIARHVGPATYEAYLAAVMRTAEAKLVREFDKRTALTEQQDSVAKTRMFIIDNILTLHCPRCKAAFLDFQNCLALTCRRADCQCGFCAACLADCRGDAHHHV